jgi:AcrR family transcriptional regulator
VEEGPIMPSASQQHRTDAGANRREAILDAAKVLMAEEGAAAVTMRGVARAAGIAPGHLSYYFPNLDALLEALIAQVITSYIETFDRLRAETREDPVAGLRSVLEYVLEDLATRETTKFFPELWVLANHEDSARTRMCELYDRYLHVLESLIAEIRPDLQEERITELALYICAAIEGQTVFIGHERPYAAHRQALKKIAVQTLLHTVQSFEG